ncbi:MAG: T9SS type A sorting domain-containing protein [Saprospiraceae bacterium]|nr:T9SS type A sorting domain-containing protein [Saprospiraceae bacterium]
MIRNLLFAMGAFLLVAFNASAQRVCASHDVLEEQLMNNPILREKLEEIERHTEDFINTPPGLRERVQVTIPVVVNVVWNTTSENISDAQIQSQIDVLNQDFRATNADRTNTPAIFSGLIADFEINFCLATQDPSGNATTGIRRQQTSTTAFSSNDAVKFTAQGGLDAWDRNKYLNLWVCDLSGGLLGYAQFPGGAAATDGVVCDYLYFGTVGVATAPFNKGRTATHEIGHWLNLRHIWGDANCGSDLVSDTPTHNTSNAGCPTYPHLSTCSGTPVEMTMNYMDYTDDACMYMFTAGQKARAQALFATGGSRVSLLTSTGCQPPTGGGTCGVASGLSATSITQTSATVSWSAASGATSYNLQYKLSSSSTWTTITGITTTSRSLTGLTANSTYNYQVQTVCGGTSAAYSTAASFTTLASGGGTCVDTYESNNTRNTAKTVPVNSTFTAQIASASDVDWYKFANTSATSRIKVDLTTLPADYDVRLYRGTSNTILAQSQNAGTADEVMIYNTTTVSTSYYAYVYGYNGAFSNTQCYTIRISLSSSNFRTDGSTDGEVQEIEVPVIFENAAFGMFPNPAGEQVTVEVPMEADADVQVTIVDPSGKAAIQQNRVMGKGDNRMNFDISRLANGIYFVEVRNGDSKSTRKLVVQR